MSAASLSPAELFGERLGRGPGPGRPVAGPVHLLGHRPAGPGADLYPGHHPAGLWLDPREPGPAVPERAHRRQAAGR
jgi:hypothetical protein